MVQMLSIVGQAFEHVSRISPELRFRPANIQHACLSEENSDGKDKESEAAKAHSREEGGAWRNTAQRGGDPAA
jgi:hypothetical protein